MRFKDRLTTVTIVSNTIDKAMAKTTSPLVVSKAIVVVKTLVMPLMFPPIIKATPSSAIALLKLAIMARTKPLEDSPRTAKEAPVSEAPKVLARSLISGSTDSMALVTKLTVIGVIKMACPIMIPKGVYRICKKPNGPDRERKR
jgi:hypothetical protein